VKVDAGFFMRRLDSTQLLVSNYEDYITAYWITFCANECSLQRAQLQASKGTCLSISKMRHVFRRKSDSAFARFDKLYDCAHRMQRAKQYFATVIGDNDKKMTASRLISKVARRP